MARNRIFDLLQNHRFWLFDVATYSQSPVGAVFDPVLGFESATPPEIVGETKTIKAGNNPYPHHFIKSAGCSPITLTRGSRWWDSDFYRWLTLYLKGETDSRRTVIMVQFLGQRSIPSAGPGRTNAYGSIGLDALVTNIPARAWVLRNCIPTSYKAGDAFQAKNSEVTILTLGMQPHSFDEVTVATLTPSIARLYSLSEGVYDQVRDLVE